MGIEVGRNEVGRERADVQSERRRGIRGRHDLLRWDPEPGLRARETVKRDAKADAPYSLLRNALQLPHRISKDERLVAAGTCEQRVGFGWTIHHDPLRVDR